jgi:hypothetical protein
MTGNDGRSQGGQMILTTTGSICIFLRIFDLTGNAGKPDCSNIWLTDNHPKNRANFISFVKNLQLPRNDGKILTEKSLDYRSLFPSFQFRV